ncbi:multidrug efflux SMR transporter [Nonomuraea sp. KC401]|uniref:Multidrug efflux SMR transporter n=1 Tax=Nonomuraea longispora TaxID=1848320 RepID=A0A4R4ML77_9ACTN|nr:MULTISPECIES: multidrug efflux SMR transporter [Nonomuraea]NBE97520.1 QacE family quaternary ammonium compound efflux SMR transporter [Nonomuraea sp. K271]TDB96648.1 multidrug efflux SMR transporter [Nonomuraea longispora]TLF62639.1 multidrug efflux SMR transporter [Nonomuraea sp. KC401]
MAWLLLTLAIASEVLATSALKLSNGFTHLGWSVVVAAGYIVSFALLAQALKLHLEVGTAYAVWSGAGTAAIAVIGALFLGETLTPLKIGGILLIIGGVVVLNLAGAH